MTTSGADLSVRNGILPNELYLKILDMVVLPIRIPSNLAVTSIFSYVALGLDEVCTTFGSHLRNSRHPRRNRSVGVILSMRDYFLDLDKTGELRELYARPSTILRPTKFPDMIQAFTDSPLNDITDLVLPTCKLPGEAQNVSSSISESYDTMRFINLMTKKIKSGTDWSDLFPKLEWISLDSRISSAPADRPFHHRFCALFNQSTKVANSKAGCGIMVYARGPDWTSSDVSGLTAPKKMVWKGQTFMTPDWRHGLTGSSIGHTIDLDLTSIFDATEEEAYPAIEAKFEELCTRQYNAMSQSNSDDSSTKIRLWVDQANAKATKGLVRLEDELHRIIGKLNESDSTGHFTLSTRCVKGDDRYEVCDPESKVTIIGCHAEIGQSAESISTHELEA